MMDAALDGETLKRLGNFLALMGSANQQEAARAREAFDRLLAKSGKSMTDLGEILRSAAKHEPSGGAAPSAGIDAAHWRDMWAIEAGLRAVADRARRGAEDRARQWERAALDVEALRRQEARQTREREAKQQAKAAAAERKKEHDQIRVDELDRTAVIKRYGSVAAVLAPCEREKLLKASVSKWSKCYTKDHPEWTTSICRCVSLRDILGRKKQLTHVMEAIAESFPLPETLEGAIGERAYWERRVRETALVRPGPRFADGDLTIQIRQHVLQSLVAHPPARSVRDVLARLQSGDMTPELQKTVIADLKCLSAATETVVSWETVRAARQQLEAPVKQQAKRQRPANGAQQTFGF
jgi:hypothetical protein